MKMTIFAAGSPGIPTEKPKGNIELIQVGDRYSIARIEKTNSAIDPIRVGDIVYSAAWSPNEPMRFALIGKIDVNRDGKDDREDLKRMIQDAGGVVDYDLPPPEYGKEQGKLSARIAWYVTDERTPLREQFQKKTDVTLAQQTEFQKKYGQAVKDARLEGIRPMPVGRLLAYLGYDMGTPIVGRAEAVNAPAMRRLIEPRKVGRPAAPAPESDTAKPQEDATKAAAPAPEPEPKAEEPKADELQVIAAFVATSPEAPWRRPIQGASRSSLRAKSRGKPLVDRECHEPTALPHAGRLHQAMRSWSPLVD